jgi:hypothetical protein
MSGTASCKNATVRDGRLLRPWPAAASWRVVPSEGRLQRIKELSLARLSAVWLTVTFTVTAVTVTVSL